MFPIIAELRDAVAEVKARMAPFDPGIRVLLGGIRVEIVLPVGREQYHIRIARGKSADGRFTYSVSATREGPDVAEFVKITTDDLGRLQVIADRVVEIWKAYTGREEIVLNTGSPHRPMPHETVPIIPNAA